MIHVVFYCDSPGFGGHEVMTLHAVEQLAATGRFKLTFVAAEQNSLLLKSLEKLKKRCPAIQIETTQMVSRSFQCIRTLIQPKAISQVARRIGTLKPDAVVVVQGTIEVGSMALHAAKSMGIPVISYIPFAHTMRRMAVKLWPIRDLVNIIHYRTPDGFITMSESMKQTLRDRGVTVPIAIPPNNLDFSRIAPREKAKARTTLGLPKEGRIVAVVGRVAFAHKAQDRWLRAIAFHRTSIPNDIRFAIIGDGQDSDAMNRLIRELRLTDIVTITPWVQDVADVYAAIDMLSIPSRFEGVPLTMMEAMYAGLPIVASNCDGMADMLPQSWLFDPNNSCTMIDTVVRNLNHPDSAVIEANSSRAHQEFDSDTMGQKFEEAILAAIALKGVTPILAQKESH